MSKRRRRKARSIPKGAWITLATGLAVALLVFLQPVLSDYGVDLGQLLRLLTGGTVQTATYPSQGTAEVHFIDVGQASCILIKGSEKTALIDGGEAATATEVTDYLAANGVTGIDYFFNTHPHADHMGGCKGIMEAVPTGEFIMAPLSQKAVPTTVGYKKLLTYLNDNKEATASTKGRVGEVYELGDGLRLTIVGPMELYDDLNNASLVIRMDFGATSVLFTGDMETLSQQEMIRQGAVGQATLLSAPHHGSDTSIDRDFMRAVNPALGVISCGAGNDYGHPSKATLELYDNLGMEYFRTDRQGSVVAITDGEAFTVTTEREG